MKKAFGLLFSLPFLLFACTDKPDALMGDWMAYKVNVQFDENKNTPELVKQIGEMEKANTFSITTDSLLIFKGLEESWRERVTLKKGEKLYCNDEYFGLWKDGQIVTRTPSPLGEIVVTYRKK